MMKITRLLGLLTLIVCLPRFVASASVHSTVKGACVIFHTPSCWHEVKESVACRAEGWPTTNSLRGEDRYIFRQGADYISIGYEYPRGYSWGDVRNLEKFLVQGDEHYEIRLDEDHKLHAISQEEWSHQKPLSPTSQPASISPVMFPAGANERVHEIKFNGRVFPRQGASFGLGDSATNLSPGKDSIAVNSWSGTVNNCEVILCIGLPAHGRYWIDLYDVLSGKRLVTVSGHYWNWEPHDVFGATMWISDRYFLAPVSEDLRNFVFCDMERAKAVKH